MKSSKQIMEGSLRVLCKNVFGYNVNSVSEQNICDFVLVRRFTFGSIILAHRTGLLCFSLFASRAAVILNLSILTHNYGPPAVVDRSGS